MIMSRKGLVSFLTICFSVLGMQWIYSVSPVLNPKGSNDLVSIFLSYYGYTSIVVGLAAYWSARALIDAVLRLQERKKA